MLMRPYTWREMDHLRREMNRLLGDWPAQASLSLATCYPVMNEWVDDDSVIITAELPGVLMDHIDISVEDDPLTLCGERQPDMHEERVTHHRRERRYGPFARTSKMPFRADAECVDTTSKNGVLSIVLPRAEEDKPRKIAVRTAQNRPRVSKRRVVK